MVLTWRPLFFPRSDENTVPTLLISTEFSSTSYNILLTDLTYIWGESLSQSAIACRTRDEGTVIELDDEGEDENLQPFLQRIKGATDGRDGTTLTLTVAIGDVQHAAPALSLRVTAEMEGLGTLEWPIKLSCMPQHSLASELLLPVIQAQHTLKKEEASLLEMLREKDHVIQKLVDKLEAQGADLGQVFPGAAGKSGRKSTRAWAEERIKGLAPFDAKTWRKDTSFGTAKDVNSLVVDVFEDNSSPNSPAVRGENITFVKHWWSGNSNSFHVSVKKAAVNNQASRSAVTRSWSPDEKENDDIDDFQVQATPPGKFSKDGAIDKILGSSDDDDLDVPSQAVPDSFPKPPSPVFKPKAVKVGGLRKRPAPRRRGNPFEDEDTETEGESEPSKQPVSDIQPPVEQQSMVLDSSASWVQKTSHGAESGVEELDDKDQITESDAEPPKKSIEISKKAASRPQKAFTRKVPQSETESEDGPSPPPMKLPAKKVKGKLGGLKKKDVSSSDEAGSVKETNLPARAATKKLGGLRKNATVVENEAEIAKPRLGGLQRKSTPLNDDMKREESPRKLGGLRKKTLSPVSDGEQDVVDRGRGKIKDVTPPPRETSEERADRKRGELKRELEEKAIKAPVKKKRKF
ncbi:hypothetical protein BP5796_06839 [Coleophoma crateriformis]|uniref:Non-homologous end-joining factor 1 n=1 Tax=Coleophoma crateriformis TaxID=565419 RepID=A0A3D8RPZ2_9HELO|nr:hypothetical protein BP5796_06839 [Coleophoma crateriformis]